MSGPLARARESRLSRRSEAAPEAPLADGPTGLPRASTCQATATSRSDRTANASASCSSASSWSAGPSCWRPSCSRREKASVWVLSWSSSVPSPIAIWPRPSPSISAWPWPISAPRALSRPRSTCSPSRWPASSRPYRCESSTASSKSSWPTRPPDTERLLEPRRRGTKIRLLVAPASDIARRHRDHLPVARGHRDAGQGVRGRPTRSGGRRWRRSSRPRPPAPAPAPRSSRSSTWSSPRRCATGPPTSTSSRRTRRSGSGSGSTARCTTSSPCRPRWARRSSAGSRSWRA